MAIGVYMWFIFMIFAEAMMLQELRAAMEQLFFPRLCEGCCKPLLSGEDVLCIDCCLQLPETNYHHIADNETALRFAGRVPFVHATSFAYFTNDGLLQHLLHGLKYKGKKEIGYFLGRYFAMSIQQAAPGGLRPDSIDIIIPVPLHRAKKAKRGYNQSLLIAEGIGKALQIPVSDQLLERTRDTESQTRKTRAERVNNMTNAFRVPDKKQLRGKHILLCDDVLTTGATIEACAAALMDENDLKISIATIGIAIS